MRVGAHQAKSPSATALANLRVPTRQQGFTCKHLSKNVKLQSDDFKILECVRSYTENVSALGSRDRHTAIS